VQHVEACTIGYNAPDLCNTSSFPSTLQSSLKQVDV
jgi:hypothetical protein